MLFNLLPLGRLNIGSLLAFRALRDFELHFLTFFKGLEAVHLNCGKMREQIFAAVIRSDEAKAFGIVEPLDGTCCHKRLSNIDQSHEPLKQEASRNAAPS